MRIALLEDDAAQAEALSHWLTGAGHVCHPYKTGKSFLDALKKDTFDSLILDWNLPDISGPKVLAWVRDNIDWRIPILFVTSRNLEADIVQALEQGADDYLIKPPKRAELLVRLASLERRSSNMPANGHLELPPYRVDLRERTITHDGKAVNLSNKEFDLAVQLFRHPGRLLSRAYLLEQVWGLNAQVNTRTVDSHISHLRSKLGITPDKGWRLVSIYQHGYRFEALPTDTDAA
jgi:two-component system, OmpR family, response regulator RegX3